jgi:hypothetical protein
MSGSIYWVYQLVNYGPDKFYWQRLCEVIADSQAHAVEGATAIYGPARMGKYKAELIHRGEN